MKKITRTAVTAAVACIAVGGVLMGAGIAAGGHEQLEAGAFHDIRESAEGAGWLDFILGQFGIVEGGSYDGEKAEKDVEVLSGDFERSIEYDGAPEALEADIGVHMLKLTEGGGSEIRLRGKNCDRIQCYMKDGTLYIKDVGKNKKYGRVSGRELTLTVPEEIFWEDVRLNASLGAMEVETLHAEKAVLDVDLGSIDIEELTADKLEIDVEMGAVNIENASVDKLKAETSMGSVEFTGVVDGDVEAETNMGGITLTFLQPESDFDYDISTDMGSITVNGKDFGGLEDRREIDNGSDRKMELKTSMGSIDICFK